LAGLWVGCLVFWRWFLSWLLGFWRWFVGFFGFSFMLVCGWLVGFGAGL